MNNILVVKHYQDGRKIEYTVPRMEAYLIWHKIVSDYPDEIVIEDGDSICIYEKDWRDRRKKINLSSDRDILEISLDYVIRFY